MVNINSKLVYSEEMIMDIEPIDQDHQQLFMLIYQLNEVDINQHNDVLVLIDQVVSLTEFHIQREETMLKACSYPFLENHRHVHQLMHCKLLEYQQCCIKDLSTTTVNQLNQFLRSWFTDHILSLDKSYETWMKNNQEQVFKANQQFESKQQNPKKTKINSNKSLGKLLVVDDEEDICELVCSVAKNLGFDTTAVNNTERFVDFYSDDMNFIVLDLSMPGVDGVELIRFLADKQCSASIILMSGMGTSILHSAKAIAEGRKLSVLKVLNKPFSIAELKAVLLANVQHQNIKIQNNEPYKPSKEDLHKAIINGYIKPFFQPKIDLQSLAIVGAEVLARWVDPEKGIIQPDQFIPLAEQEDLIYDLTIGIICQSLKQCSRWLSSGQRLFVSINMSAKILDDLKFPDWLFLEVTKYGLDPSQVIIEVTESSVFNQLNESLDILTRLRLKGFGLSIDDFGTGYSSLKQLKSVPFTELKIDQSFVKEADTDKEAHILCETTINLGQKLNMSVVAEGIETENVWHLLTDLGCHEGQGYFIAKPMNAEDFALWCQQDFQLPQKNFPTS